MSQDAVLKNFPKWLLGFGVLVYSTGFLTLYNFYRLFNITDIGGDFLKARYIHVGIMYFSAILLITIPIFMLVPTREAPLSTRLDMSVPLIPINLIVAFYGVVIFTPPGYMAGKSHWILAIAALSLIGLSGVTWFSETFVIIASREIVKRWLRWIVLIVLLAIDVVVFWNLAAYFGEMLWRGGMLFVFIVIVAAVLAIRITVIFGRNQLRSGRGAVAVVGVIIIGALYYLSVMMFALFIFPYIPAAKGGGDFRFGADVRIIFRTDDDAIALSLINSQQADKKISNELKVVHETSATIFVADPRGVESWRHFGSDRPTVLGINKMFINTVEYVKK